MRDELKNLARAYADGTITAEQLRRLESLLKADVEARERYLAELNLIHTLEERSLSSDLESTTNLPTLGWFNRWTAITVVAASAVVIASFMRLGRDSDIGSIVDIQGQVRWTGNDGMVVENLSAGTSLPGGTLQLLSADAWASFRFDDQSTLTVSGESEVVVAKRRGTKRGKEIHLRNGNLSADVRPQPPDGPMIVHTPSAKLHVLGTRFNVAAKSTKTVLVVNEGRVRMIRSADGDETDVAAGRQASASFDTIDNLVVRRLAPEVTSWTIDLEADVLHGDWKPVCYELALELKQAVASGTMKEEDAIEQYKRSITLRDLGSVWAKPSEIGCFVWLQVGGLEDASVVATPRTRIRVAGQMLTETELEFGISTYAIDGGFSGKYARRFGVQDLRLDESGRFELDIDIADFQAKLGGSAIGSRIHDWWCATGRNDAKLEITLVEIVQK